MSLVAISGNVSGTGTLTIAAPNTNSNYTLTLPAAAGVMYAQGNIVGTVSQSGGVPTGAIIERGSNANGEYVKYADGTMICNIIGVTLSYSTSSRLAYTWTFPASFVSSTSYSSSLMAGGGTALGATQWIDTKTASTARYSFITNAGYVVGNSATDCSLTAIGRWY